MTHITIGERKTLQKDFGHSDQDVEMADAIIAKFSNDPKHTAYFKLGGLMSILAKRLSNELE